MKEARVDVHIEATNQDTTAIWKLEGLSSIDTWIAMLYNIQNLKPFVGTSKVNIRFKDNTEIETEFYVCDYEDGKLIQHSGKPLDFWVKRSNKESEDKSMIHTVKITENKALEEYWLMRGIKKQYDNLGNEKKVVCREREVSQYPDLGAIAQFLSDSNADFVSVEHNYRFAEDLPFC